MIAALVLEFFLLYYWHEARFLGNEKAYLICAAIWQVQFVITATYLAWKYLP